MALNINGTTGISGVDGSASAPALQGTDSNTGINFASDTVNINTGGTTRATVDSSGNLNIPDGGKIQLGASQDLKIYHDSGGNSFIEESGSGHLVIKAQDYYLQNAAGSTTHMLVDSSGDLRVGRIYSNTTSGGANVRVQSDGLMQRDTSSRRYKNTITDATHGLADLNKLRPVTYKGNNDGDTVFGGLIAEEVHDAGLTEFVDYDSDNQPDALKYGNMVSLCIKAIQELSAKVETLETKVAALEAG